MKTAQEMREIATNKKLSGVNQILASIEMAAKKGETEMWWYETITMEQREKLTELGYNVGATQWNINDQLTIIKW